ncbi:hypothetical protein ACVH9Z_34320 [Rhodococcus opacus]|uniref:hypothetical protein n=1 Tax=Rhodococcus opacus TaxID=37919 RepID=UPI001B30DFB5|nr:hypothetical protein [Rhodococcus opacus]
MGLDQRVVALIGGLSEKSRSGALQWESTGPEQYELSLTKSTIRVESRDGDGMYPYQFTLLNENGVRIETIDADGSASDPYQIRDLFDTASRSHRGVDAKLDEVLGELGIKLPEEPPF